MFPFYIEMGGCGAYTYSDQVLVKKDCNLETLSRLANEGSIGSWNNGASDVLPGSHPSHKRYAYAFHILSPPANITSIK